MKVKKILVGALSFYWLTTASFGIAEEKGGVKEDFKEAGHSMKTGFKKTGSGIKKGAKKTGHAFKSGGKSFKREITK